MCTPGALDIFREVRLYTTLWGQDRRWQKSRVPMENMGLGWRSLGSSLDLAVAKPCVDVGCTGAQPVSMLLAWHPGTGGSDGTSCHSPLTLQPWAGWQHFHWVLRVVCLGLSTWQGHGKGTDTQSTGQSLVFPNNPMVLPFFSMGARSWPGGGEGREILGRSFPQGAPRVGLDGTWCYRSSSQLPLAGRC